MAVRIRNLLAKEWIRLFGACILTLLVGVVLRLRYRTSSRGYDLNYALADALIVTGIIGSLLELFSAKFLIERAADDLAEKLVERVVQALCVFKGYHSTSFWRGLRGAKILAHRADILGPGLGKPSPNYCSQILWPS